MMALRLVWLNRCPPTAVPFPECVTMDEDNYNVDLESKDATYLMRSAAFLSRAVTRLIHMLLSEIILLVLQQN